MRNKLILAFLLVVLVSFGGVLILSRLGVASEVRSFIQTGGQQHIQETAIQLEQYYLAQGSWEGAEKFLQRPAGQGAGRFGQGGGPGATTGGMNQNLILADENQNVVAATAGTEISIGETLSDEIIQNGITLYEPGTLTGRKEVVGYLLSYNTLRFGTAEESLLVERLSLAALLAGGVSGIVALLLSLYLTYRLLAPIRQLTSAARGLASGDLSQRVPVSSGIKNRDELNELGLTFNMMADSLQKAQETRQAMTADIAHELRTPLSVQRATLEALQDGIYPLDTDSLIPLLEQNHTLSRLVEDLRTLAMTDAGQLRLERTTADLCDFLHRVQSRFQAAADSGQVNLRLEMPEGSQNCQVYVDPLRMEQVLNNLLSNALRHTPSGGQITIRLANKKTDPSSWCIEIEDNGPGIPEDALPHIFERFYRADKSRSREGGGSGLGLTIARDLVRAHGGDLKAANIPNGGAKFSIIIPKSDVR